MIPSGPGIRLRYGPLRRGALIAERFHAVGIERGVLRALGALAGEADHVMRDQRCADQLRDAPGAQRLRGKSPEDASIVTANADAEGNLGEQYRATPQISAS